MRGLLTTSREVTRTQILMLYDQDGSLGGQSRSSLAAGIASRLLLKISLCVRILSTNKTITFAKKCTASIISTTHLISNFFFFVFSYHRTTLSLHILPPSSCDWKSWISILKCPALAWTSTPLESAARSPPAYLPSNILLGIQQLVFRRKVTSIIIPTLKAA